MSEPKKGRNLLEYLKKLFGLKQPPGDPYIDRLVPVRSGLRGRSGAAAAEPEEDSFRAFPPGR